MDDLLKLAYTFASIITAGSVWPLLLQRNISLAATLSLLALTIFVVGEDFLEAKNRYKDYPARRKSITIINILYIAVLISLSIETFFIVQNKISLAFYSLTLCIVSILDIVFCLLYLRDVRDNDLSTRIKLIVNFIMGRDFPGLVFDSFITVLLFTKILNGFLYPLAFMWTTTLLEVVIAYSFSFLVKKHLTLPGSPQSP